MTPHGRRDVTHPGPRSPERRRLVPTTAREARLTLRAGRPLDAAIAEAFAEHGADSGWLRLEGIAVAGLAYVLPDHAPGTGQVAWYSDPLEFGAGMILRAGMIWGRRDGLGFGHCHGLWSAATDPDGMPPRIGHLLAPDTTVAADVQVPALLFADARFDASPDPETGFTLFSPVATGPAPDDADAALLRICPDEDLALAVSAAVAHLGWAGAHAEGIGSINEVRLRDGRVLPSYATEFLISDATAGPRDAKIALDVVGLGGATASGVVTQGDNPVLITAEIILTRA